MSEIKINLPETSFPMKANLPTKEPEILEFWEQINLYQELRSKTKGREKFILHDGPPYANGHIHIGTALNKILKDIVVRFNQMSGKDAPYVPGWDCHGLPIEWKVEEEYKKKEKIRTPFQLMSLEKNVENLQQVGSRFKRKNLID